MSKDERIREWSCWNCKTVVNSSSLPDGWHRWWCGTHAFGEFCSDCAEKVHATEAPKTGSIRLAIAMDMLWNKLDNLSFNDRKALEGLFHLLSLPHSPRSEIRLREKVCNTLFPATTEREGD